MRIAPALCALLLSAAFAAAQTGVPGRTKAPPDPYTRGEPAALQRAGYVSLGPFQFGSNHTTAEVEELLGNEPLVWIETAHFRLGCALSPVVVKSKEPWAKEWQPRLREELKRLSARLPRVPAEPKELDPWLRAHLFAQRLEDLYSEVQGYLGVTDADFPAAPGDDARDHERFRGLGPYLGMREKFSVLVVQKSASHARYTRAWHGKEMAEPERHHDAAMGRLHWSGSEETTNSLFRIDPALHSSMVFNVAHNLLAGYRAYGHELPAWFVTGMSHWYARRVSPRFPTYDRKSAEDREQRSGFWDWGARAPGLMKNGVFEPLQTFLLRDDALAFGIEQHIQAWSLVDHLMAVRRAELMGFLRLAKTPFHARTRLPDRKEWTARMGEAWQQAIRASPAEVEAQWRERLLQAKPRK